jgi:lipoprotein NlpD
MPARLQKNAFRFLASLALISLLAGCAGLSKSWNTQAYTVNKGDTLYSIAWKYEKDFRQIAEWNNISAPYDIFPGQRLIMQPANKDGTLSREGRPQVLVDSVSGESIGDAPAKASEPLSVAKNIKRRSKHVTVQKNDTLYSIARREGYTHHQIARWNHIRSPYALKPGQKLRLTPPQLSSKRVIEAKKSAVILRPLVVNKVIAKPIAQKTKLPNRVDKWRWPSKGRVVKTFKSNDTARKGIGIRGRLGQPVLASAAGTVVYSGNGLINYGNLIIIKHSHSYLSAYAHNKKLLVKEGDSVKPGQTIAKMGSPDSSKAQLHFEIRRNGKPVNPLHYLPKS